MLYFNYISVKLEGENIKGFFERVEMIKIFGYIINQGSPGKQNKQYMWVCVHTHTHTHTHTATAAKSLQSCPTLCDPIDGSPPSSPVPGILQARTLEWVSISFSNV